MGGRAISCTQDGNSLSITAWPKSDNTFEMYRQSFSGTAPKICLGSTCIQNNGFAKSGTFPICLNTTTNGTNTTGNQTNTTQNISIVDSTPSGSMVDIAEPQDQTFTITLDNPSSLSTAITWRLDGVNQTASFNELSYTFLGDYNTAGVHEVLVTAQSPHNTVSKLWTLVVADMTPPNGTGNETNTSIANASLAFAPWFPQGRNAILVCTATGFVPTSYDFIFGDGEQNLNYNQNNVWHTYQAAGTYTATCVARNGVVSKNATLSVVLP